MTNPYPKTGSVIDGKFRVLDIAGTGATAIILKCNDVRNKRIVALKRFLPDKLTKVLEARAFGEPRLAINSYYAVRSEECFRDREGFINAVMPFVDGKNLRDFLDLHNCLDEVRAVYVGLCLCRAASDIHGAGVVATDIKPDNTIITNEGIAKLVDLTCFERMGKQGEVSMGTQPYAAPELLKRRVLTESTDVYSIGMTLCELLVGGEDFIRLTDWWQQFSYEPDLGAVYQRFPKASRIIGKAIHPEKNKRYKTTKQLFDELLHYYNGMTHSHQDSQNKVTLVCSCGKELRLQSGMFVIGRNHISPTNFNISEKHFEIDYNGNGKAKIKEAGSMNGTRINGKKLYRKWRLLHDGDIVQIADVQIRVKLAT